MGTHYFCGQSVLHLGSSEYWKDYLKAEMKHDPWLCLHTGPAAMSIQGEKNMDELTHAALNQFYFLCPWAYH